MVLMVALLEVQKFGGEEGNWEALSSNNIREYYFTFYIQ